MQSINLGNAEQFKQSFREEAHEILVDLEAALLELNDTPADVELVGRVFRGLHTIKGSGSMFGFEHWGRLTRCALCWMKTKRPAMLVPAA